MFRQFCFVINFPATKFYFFILAYNNVIEFDYTLKYWYGLCNIYMIDMWLADCKTNHIHLVCLKTKRSMFYNNEGNRIVGKCSEHVIVTYLMTSVQAISHVHPAKRCTMYFACQITHYIRLSDKKFLYIFLRSFIGWQYGRMLTICLPKILFELSILLNELLKCT